jgi:YidC/Oxa1 family membrane protein insertase
MVHSLLAVAFFQALLNAIGALLSRVYDLVPNYGATIIIFTIAIRVILLPLNIKQVRSMQASQALQPKIKEIQRKYKSDRMKMSEEVNKLYKEHGVSPLGGCFPLVAQLPVLFALYAVLRVPSGVQHIPVDSGLRTAIVQQQSGVKLLGANLLCSTKQAGTTVKIPPAHPPAPIKELKCGATGTDKVTFYALVLLMIGTTYYQQRQMLKASPGGPTQQQQTLTYMMPLVFGFLGFTFPSGLVLYWTTTNCIQIGIQHFVRKNSKGELPPAKPEREAPPKPKSGPTGDGARRVRRLEGRPSSQSRRKPPPSSSKRSGNAGSRKKRPNR